MCSKILVMKLVSCEELKYILVLFILVEKSFVGEVIEGSYDDMILDVDEE